MLLCSETTDIEDSAEFFFYILGLSSETNILIIIDKTIKIPYFYDLPNGFLLSIKIINIPMSMFNISVASQTYKLQVKLRLAVK